MLNNKRFFMGLGILQLFISLGAIPAGISFLLDPSGKGLGMATDLLKNSPFINFFIPGLYLLSINGIGNLIGAIFSFRKQKYASNLGMILGSALIIWIVAQVYWIGLVSWLQPFFLVVGIIELFLGYKLMLEHYPTNFFSYK